MRHYLELGHTLYALCGAAITKAEHATDPDCPTCRTALDARNAETAEERFGTADDHRPVTAFQPFNAQNRAAFVAGLDAIHLAALEARLPVTSSTIKTIAYTDGLLHVEFLSGAVWAYYDVPVAMYAAMLASPSVGQFYTQRIRGRYRSEKLLDALPRPVRGFSETREESANG